MTQLSNMQLPVILDQSLAGAFPEVDPCVKPLGHHVLVQLKNAALKTQYGIELTGETVLTEFDNTQVAKVIALGPVAYRSRETLELWPEGHWCKAGDFVRIPQHTNSVNTWSIRHKGQRVTFTMLDDLSIVGIQPDPFAIKAFV